MRGVAFDPRCPFCAIVAGTAAADVVFRDDVAVVLDPTSVDVPDYLRERSDGLGVDAVIECSGHANGLATGVH